MIFFKKDSIDYCFIHIPKTAGTSFQNTIIQNKLDNKQYNLKFKNFMDKFNSKFDHTPLYFINNYFLNEFKLQKKIEYITIIRNPWQRLASLFEQELLRESVGLHKVEKKDLRNRFNKNYELITKNLLNGLGFFDSNKRKDLFKFWLLYLGYNRKILPNLNPNFNLLPQSWWFHDELTNKSIQQTFLFEDLESLEVSFGIKLSHENNKTIKFDYKDYYDQETIEYVYNLDKFVINKYNYDF